MEKVDLKRGSFLLFVTICDGPCIKDYCLHYLDTHQAPINFHHSFKVKGVQKNSGSFLLNKISEGIS